MPIVSHGLMGAELDQLLMRLPRDANAIVILDVEKIFASQKPLADRWRREHADSLGGATLKLPASARRFLLAADFDIEHMHPRWEAASMELSADPSMEQIVEWTGGQMDRLSDHDTVWTEHGACIVRYAPHEFGALAPANRQFAARWVRHGRSNRPDDYSPYLRHAVGYSANAGTEIILAIDLKDILRPEEIEQAVSQSPLLKGINSTEAVQVLASLEGITLGVRLGQHSVGRHASGKLKIDFGHPTSIFRSVAGPMILAVLTKAGAMLDEFDGWLPEAEGNHIAIGGRLTDEGMLRLFSFILLDTTQIEPETTATGDPNHPDQAQQASPSPTTAATERITEKRPDDLEARQEAMAKRTRRYFQTVEKYLKDLQRRGQDRPLSQVLLWMNNYSRSIDRLPSRRIDPQMAAYGRYVASRLRNVIATIHDSAERADSEADAVVPEGEVTVGVLPTYRTANVGGYRTREYAPFAYSNMDVGAAHAEQRKIRAEEARQGIDEAHKIMDEVQEETAALRKIMTRRYGIEF